MKKQASTVTKLLTRDHHRIINNFLALKRDYENVTRDHDHLRASLIKQDLTVASEACILEAAFGVDKAESQLKMYDCLIPFISEEQNYRSQIGIR